MHYRKLGRTGSMTAEIGFGAWSLEEVPDDDEAMSLVRYALELGAGLIDVADVYGDGRAEKVVGRAIEGRREQALIATKGGLVLRDGSLSRDFSPNHLYRAAQESRERLRTDYIDLYQLHHPDPEVLADAEVWETVERLKSEGVVRHVGVVAATPDAALAAVDCGRAETLQVVFNAVDASLLAAVRWAHAAGLGVIARAPLCGGLLGTAYAPDHQFGAGDRRLGWPREQLQRGLQLAARLRERAREGDRMPAQTAIAWVLGHSEVSVTIPGARSREQVAENVATSDLPLPSPRVMAAVQHLQLTAAV